LPYFAQFRLRAFLLISFLLSIVQTKADAVVQDLDSLIIQLQQEQNDSIKVHLFLSIADEFLEKAYLDESFSDSALVYSNRALRLSIDTEFQQGIVSSYKSLGVLMNNRGRMDSSEFYLLKALEQLGQNSSQDQKADVLTRLGITYMYKEQNKADSIFNLALALIDSTVNNEINRYLYLNIGLYDLEIGDFPAALSTFQRAIQLAERVNDWMIIGNGLQYIGRVYREMGVMEKAILFADSSKLVLLENGGVINEASVNYELGILHAQLREPDLDKSIDYFKKSLQVQMDRGHLMNIANCYTALSIVYSMKGESSVSDDYLKKSVVYQFGFG